ncbi:MULTISPECIES: hypothetical protein [unclassified Microbacterium]|uniref:hypothetical protein n=1 Tax=unclassified Microbacterium TaxID=2609290 RepID=UPI003868A1BC
MREGAPAEVLEVASRWYPNVSSWLDGDMLADNIPVIRGQVLGERSQQVPERVTLTVARYSTVDGRQFDWLPGGDPLHPLARFGQRLTVTITVTSARTSADYQTQIGVFAVQDWQENDDGSVAVSGLGVLQFAADDRLTSPVSPTGTLGQEFRKLLPTVVQGAVSPALTDRVCPDTFNWSEDRLGAVYEIADAWPARVRTDVDGVVWMLPPLPEVPTPVLVFEDGVKGTLVSAPRADSRATAANQVTAESSGNQNPVTVTVAKLSGPMRVDGPYGVVSHRFSSAALKTEQEVRAAAEAKLTDLLRGARTYQVECAPDPRVEIDDPVEIRRNGERLAWGWVNSFVLPLTVADGPMTFEVGVA